MDTYTRHSKTCLCTQDIVKLVFVKNQDNIFVRFLKYNDLFPEKAYGKWNIDPWNQWFKNFSQKIISDLNDATLCMY